VYAPVIEHSTALACEDRRPGCKRIHHAKVLFMGEPDAGIKDLSLRCSFGSVSYFDRVFRETTGYTPQGYRLGVSQGQLR
jgi:AraC-like DNA-binding protein